MFNHIFYIRPVSSSGIIQTDDDDDYGSDLVMAVTSISALVYPTGVMCSSDSCSIV